MGRKTKYFTEEERKAAHREADKKWRNKNIEKAREMDREKAKRYREKHPEVISRYNKLYHQEHKEEIAEYEKQYKKTPNGRAKYLASSYCRCDKKANRGECTLTTQWIVDNIFSKPCHYCGETDWHKLGCDRIDNSKPHTEDNVVPCCWDCNRKRHTMDYEEYKKTLIESL